MSQLIATVSFIKNEQTLHMVNFDFQGIKLKMMSLELNEKIKVGVRVALNIKPTHIMLVKDFKGTIACSNRIYAKVVEVENGKILSSIKLQIKDTILESLITTDLSKKMDVKKDDELLMLIKENELSIMEILDD